MTPGQAGAVALLAAFALVSAGGPLSPPGATADLPIAAVPGKGPALAALSADGRRLWRRLLPAPAAGSVVAGGRVVVALPDRLVGLGAADGWPGWELPLDGRPTPPARHGELVVVGTSAGRLVAVDPATGRPGWIADAGGPIAAPPTPAGDLLVVGTKSREVLAVTASGDVRWRAVLGGRVTAPAAVLPGVVYVAAWDGRLSGLDPETGETRWTAPLGGAVEIALAAAREAGGSDVVVALRADGVLVAVAAPPAGEGEGARDEGSEAEWGGRVIWTRRVNPGEPPPTADGGRLFLGGSDLTALDLTSGRVLWRLSETLERSFRREMVRRLVDREVGFSPEEVRAARVGSPYELRGAVVGPLIVAGGLLLAVTDERFIYAVDPATGELRWRIAEGD